jgi:hypothetical protein
MRSVIIDWQFDDFLMASMIFHKDGRVELINNGGIVNDFDFNKVAYFNSSNV